jgi:hypothetical protein
MKGPVSGPKEGRQMTYRKRNGKDTWHFCRNCSNWPTSDYKEQHEKPTSGEFCNECKSKKADNNCT